MRSYCNCRAGGCFVKSSGTLLLEKMRAPRVAGLHVRQEQAKTSMSRSMKATLSSADAADSAAAQQQRLHSQSTALTRPSGEGQDEGNALQQRDAKAQHDCLGRDIAAYMSDMQGRRDGDEHDGRVFLDSVDCLEVD